MTKKGLWVKLIQKMDNIKDIKEWKEKVGGRKKAIEILQQHGFSRTHANRILSGWKTVKYTTALKLANITGLPVEEFLRIQEDYMQGEKNNAK